MPSEIICYERRPAEDRRSSHLINSHWPENNFFYPEFGSASFLHFSGIDPQDIRILDLIHIKSDTTRLDAYFSPRIE